MVKKVSFSNVIKVVMDSGEIKYERDWGATSYVFDFLGQYENIDFIQQQFDRHLSMLGKPRKFDSERLPGIGLPFLSCTSQVVEKVGAVEYLRHLAESSRVGCMAPSRSQSRGVVLTTLPIKKHPKPVQKLKRRGILRPKEIPGRDTAEQRKMRMVKIAADRQHEQGRVFEKFAELERQQERQRRSKKPESILKDSQMKVIDLTSIDDASLFRDEETVSEGYYRCSEVSFLDEDRQDEVFEGRETPLYYKLESNQSENICQREDPPSAQEEDFTNPHSPAKGGDNHPMLSRFTTKHVEPEFIRLNHMCHREDPPSSQDSGGEDDEWIRSPPRGIAPLWKSSD